jgi:class 3 adenylate cyclase
MPQEPGRRVVTVLFLDLVGSTAIASDLGDHRWRHLLSTFLRTVRAQLKRFGGHEEDTTGDGLFATFDAPDNAIRCAEAIATTVHELGLEVRCGLHAGGVETIDGKLGGIAVHIGARVMSLGGPAEVLVTSTVRDLVAGSASGRGTCLDEFPERFPVPGVRRLPRSDRPRGREAEPSRPEGRGAAARSAEGPRDGTPGLDESRNARQVVGGQARFPAFGLFPSRTERGDDPGACRRSRRTDDGSPTTATPRPATIALALPPLAARQRSSRRAEQPYYPVVTLQISLFPKFCGQSPRGHGAGKTRVPASCDC